MSLIVDQLESYDRSNLEVIRIEFAKLQRKLEKCQDDKDDFSNAEIGRLTLISVNVKREFYLKFTLSCTWCMLHEGDYSEQYILIKF